MANANSQIHTVMGEEKNKTNVTSYNTEQSTEDATLVDKENKVGAAKYLNDELASQYSPEILEIFKGNESTLKSTTGLEAAQETGGYQWEKQAAAIQKSKTAASLYEQQQALLGSAKNVQQNAQQAAITSELGKYTVNQTAEKRGWLGGGSALDMEQQLNYLKSSIQADLFNQAELQKLGYDLTLAKARMEYDLGRQELALQYYQQAMQNAINMAQVTDIWISPEMQDMLSQGSAAQKILNDPNTTEEEKAKAERVIQSVDKWFADNGLSKTGWLTAAGILAQAQAYYYRMESLANQATFNEAVQRVYQQLRDEGRIAIPVYNEEGTIIGYKDLTAVSPEEQRRFFSDADGQFDYKKFKRLIEEAYYGISEVTDLLEKVAPDGTYEIDGFTIVKTTDENGSAEFSVVHNNPQEFLDREKNDDGSYNLKIAQVEQWLQKYAPNGSEVVYVIANRDSSGNITSYTGIRMIVKDGKVTTYRSNEEKTPGAATESVKVTPKEQSEITVDKIKEKYKVQTGDAGISAFSAKPDEFGKFWDYNKPGSKQYKHVEQILSYAKEGKIPDGTLISFNYGAVGADLGVYVYIQDRFYKVPNSGFNSWYDMEKQWGTKVYTDKNIHELASNPSKASNTSTKTAAQEYKEAQQEKFMR